MCQAIREMIQDGFKEGFTEGFMEGFREGILISKKEMALSLSAMGMPAERIAEVVRVSVALVRDWISEKDE